MKKRLFSIILIIACFAVALFPCFNNEVSASADIITNNDSLGGSLTVNQYFYTETYYSIIPRGAGFYASLPVGTRVFFECKVYSMLGLRFTLQAYFGYPNSALYQIFNSDFVFDTDNVLTTITGSFIVIDSPTGQPMDYFYCWSCRSAEYFRMWYYTPLGTVLDYSDNMITTVVNNQSIFNVFYSPQDGITPLGFILISLLAVVLFLLVLYIVKKIIFRGE